MEKRKRDTLFSATFPFFCSIKISWIFIGSYKLGFKDNISMLFVLLQDLFYVIVVGLLCEISKCLCATCDCQLLRSFFLSICFHIFLHLFSQTVSNRLKHFPIVGNLLSQLELLVAFFLLGIYLISTFLFLLWHNNSTNMSI